jgi:hypothetical protein
MPGKYAHFGAQWIREDVLETAPDRDPLVDMSNQVYPAYSLISLLNSLSPCSVVIPSIIQMLTGSNKYQVVEVYISGHVDSLKMSAMV